MTSQIMILIFWSALILCVWYLFRSKLFRGSCEDMKAMKDAPEYKNKAKTFEAYMANSAGQLSDDKVNSDSTKSYSNKSK